MELLTLFINNFFTQPAFFIGAITLIGLAALRKPWYECLSGFIKTAVGFYILSVGSGGLTSTFSPLISALGQKFGMEAALVDTYFLFGQMMSEDGLYSIGNALTWTMLAYVVSIIWNFVLVSANKITRCRTLYVTGHTLQVYTQTWLWFVYLIAPSTRNLAYSLLFGILGGTWAAVGSNITFEATQKLTGGAGFAIGHQEMFGVWYVDKLAKKLGKPEDNIENLKLPGFLSIFKDNIVSITIIMSVFFGTLMVVIGKDTMQAADTAFNTSWVMPIYVLNRCMHFSVYLYILMAGVRMFVSELMRAFEGFQQKLIKGSIPAVDVAVTYNYTHPNVPLLGFIMGFIGQVVAIVGLLLFKSPLFLVPGFVPLFFDNASLAVFANRSGGKKAAIIIPVLNGIFQVLVSFVMILFIKHASGVSLTAWPGFTDNNVTQPIILGLTYLLNPYVAVVIVIVGLLLFNQLHYRKNKEHYYDYMKTKPEKVQL